MRWQAKVIAFDAAAGVVPGSCIANAGRIAGQNPSDSFKYRRFCV